MHIKEYLAKYRLSLEPFAREMEVSKQCLHVLSTNKASPSLLSAIKILILSKSEITLKDILSFKDQEKLEVWMKKKKLSANKDFKLVSKR